ncbi:MAG: hypothetical protein ACLVDB_05820 [Anaeromassilibacillus sp.]
MAVDVRAPHTGVGIKTALGMGGCTVEESSPKQRRFFMEQMIKSPASRKQTLLKSKLDVLINHPVTKGDHCEGAWIDFFRAFAQQICGG